MSNAQCRRDSAFAQHSLKREKNLGEPGYYARLGFERASEYGLDNKYGADEGFMVKPPRERAVDNVNGIVAYRPEFQEVEN